MHQIKMRAKFLGVIYLCLCMNCAFGSILDYFSFGSTINKDETQSTLQQVPFEVEIADDKFIEQAAKLTDVALSDLDKCQHRVIFKLQSDCHKLNDEELAKLAVKLLNCQSFIEGRPTYPCTEQMAIRDCTSSMDSDTWNSYLLMSNRARAVCYSIRQAQFRGLTEMTVNKLMNTAHEQINIMSKLQDGQSRLEAATSEAFDDVIKQHEVLKIQQDDLKKAQFFGQLTLEDNIRRLANEKQLIIEGHERLLKMAKDIQRKLAETSEQLEEQASEREVNHKEILRDLIEIHKQTQMIFAVIDDSSHHLMEKSLLVSKQYDSALAQLAQVNSTVNALLNVVSNTNVFLEKKFKWLSDSLGGTDYAIDRLYLVVTHFIFLILAMISCSFLQVPLSSRIALIILVPCNLMIAIVKGYSLNITALTTVIITFIIGQLSLIYFSKHRHKQTSNFSLPSKLINTANELSTDSLTDDEYENTPSVTSTNRYNNYSNMHIFASPTPPNSRLDRSRSTTPHFLTSPRKCVATTRAGLRCKGTPLMGRDFCFAHQTGSSVFSE